MGKVEPVRNLSCSKTVICLPKGTTGIPGSQKPPPRICMGIYPKFDKAVIVPLLRFEPCNA